MIRGLHTCQPGNTPSVGQIKLFSIEERQGKSGKPWTKISNAADGQPYMIMSVAKTDYQDPRGNLSFNLELEPAAHTPQPIQNGPQTSVNPPPARFNGPPATPTPADSPKQHLMRAANLYCLCIDAADTVIRDKMRVRNIDLHEHYDWFQAVVATLFIDAQRAGYVQHMSDKEQKPQTGKEPY